MKTRVKSVLILSAATLWLAAGNVLAQSPGPAPDHGASRMDRLAILLDLDAGQKAAVKTVFDEQRASRLAMHQAAKDSGTRPTREAMQAKHAAMRKETVEKLRPILSDQQLTKFEVLTEHPRGARHRWNRGKHHAPASSSAPSPGAQ